MPEETVQYSFRIPRKLKRKLNKHIKWGIRDDVFQALCEDLVELLESNHAPLVLGGILTRDISASDILKEAPDDG